MRLIILFLLLALPCRAYESFLVLDLYEMGTCNDIRIPPCSTFKIALSLIGFDQTVLKNEKIPLWHYQEGLDDYLEIWKEDQTPKSWIKNSCIWYSKLLVEAMGIETVKDYLKAFDYGNQDLSQDTAWVAGSLTISPREQVIFLNKMLSGALPVSEYAVKVTKQLLFVETLEDGYKLYGKTGFCKKRGWFVGWVEKDARYFPFAYTTEDQDLAMRIPRTKELLKLCLNPFQNKQNNLK